MGTAGANADPLMSRHGFIGAEYFETTKKAWHPNSRGNRYSVLFHSAVGKWIPISSDREGRTAEHLGLESRGPAFFMG